LITWTALPPYPAGPVGRLAAGTVFNNFMRLIIFTGGDPTGAGTQTMGDTWAYDIGQDKWLIGPQKITPVSNISDFVGLIANDTLWMASVAGYDGTNISNVNEWLCLGTFVWTGVNEPSSLSANSFVAYPNPVSNELTIVMKENSKNSILTIADVSGRIVHKENIARAQSSLKLNASNYDAGIYFITVTGDDGSVNSVKFIKE